MNQSKVTLIMPVYNTEETLLKKCVESIIKQTNNCWNLIMIDDGSTQKTADICEQFTADKRIRVVHKKNAGVSAARNYGTSLVTSAYTMYVDSDDVLSDFVIEDALNIAEATDADIVYGGVYKIQTQDSFQNYSALRSSNGDITLYSKDDILSAMFGGISDELNKIQGEGQIIRAPFARLIKSEIARRVLFPEDFKIGEDIVWNSRLLNSCSRVAVAKSIWYGYVQYPHSAINKYYGNRIDITEQWIKILVDENNLFFSKHPENMGQMLAVEYYVIICYDVLPSLVISSIREKNKIVKQMTMHSPWNLLYERKYRSSLLFQQKLLLMSGKLRLGALAVIIYLKIKSFLNI